MRANIFTDTIRLVNSMRKHILAKNGIASAGSQKPPPFDYLASPNRSEPRSIGGSHCNEEKGSAGPTRRRASGRRGGGRAGGRARGRAEGKCDASEGQGPDGVWQTAKQADEQLQPWTRWQDRSPQYGLCDYLQIDGMEHTGTSTRRSNTKLGACFLFGNMLLL